MQVIDAHQHFWQYDPVRHDWINEAMSVIRRDFLPADLAPILQENGVTGCVAVQADQTEAETEFLLTMAEQQHWIRGVVGWVDLRADNIRERLSYFSNRPRLKGFRHVLQGEDPSFMLQPDFQRGIAALKEFGFTYDILIFPHHLDAALQLVQQHPGQSFVIDHMAKPYIKAGLIDAWKTGMERLAALPNVSCKISGMVTEADWKLWKEEDLYPYLDVVLEAFGTNRLLFGSDWPVCLVAASYASMLRPVQKYCSKLSATEQQQLFAGNTISFYHL